MKEKKITKSFFKPYCFKCSRLLLAVAISSCFMACRKEVSTNEVLVPQPVSTKMESGEFQFTEHTVISADSEAQSAAAYQLSGLFAHSGGFQPKVCIDGRNEEVCFVTDSTMVPEAYRITVKPDHLQIESADSRGSYYAVQTLRQLLSSKIEMSSRVTGMKWTIPAMEVYDEPRFEYRGFMLDVARFFMPKDDLLKIIDCMGLLKLNALHLHLSDDNGWRLEIKKYPRLTSVGASRVDRGGQPFPNRRNALPGEPVVPGGYYTQDEMKEIIDYAAQRQITVIPEIDMPAHSNAALAAYPQYACPVVDRPISVLPGLGGPNAHIIYCAGNEKTFSFIQDILDEVIALFPGKYIHIGGDEAWKTYWKRCPLCQRRIKQEKLKDEEALQGYFMQRISHYIQHKGKEVMGWDELTNSRIPEGAIVFGWQGKGQAAIKAAQQGHRFVLTPAQVLYLIRYQGPQWFEPLTYFGNNTLKDVYDYEPVGTDWSPAYKSLFMGIQASMWTEFCSSSQNVMYQLFPRLIAFAETAWSPSGSKDWSSFLKRMDRFLPFLESKNLQYARSMYNIQHKVSPVEGKLEVKLECIRPDVDIRYTLNGMDPTAKDERYLDPLIIDKECKLKAATFREGKRIGEVLTLKLVYNMATGHLVTTRTGQFPQLTNGVRGSLRESDFEWCIWNRTDTLVLRLDLGKRMLLHRLVVGTLTNYGMAIHKPRFIAVEASEDGNHYELLAAKRFTDEEIFIDSKKVDNICFKLGARWGRYLKIYVGGPGRCPSDHLRPGQLSRYCLDELWID